MKKGKNQIWHAAYFFIVSHVCVCAFPSATTAAKINFEVINFLYRTFQYQFHSISFSNGIFLSLLQVNLQHRHIWYKKSGAHTKNDNKTKCTIRKKVRKIHTLIEEGRKKILFRGVFKSRVEKNHMDSSLFFLHSYCLCAKLHLIFTFLFKHSFISMICEISKLFFFLLFFLS